MKNLFFFDDTGPPCSACPEGIKGSAFPVFPLSPLLTDITPMPRAKTATTKKKEVATAQDRAICKKWLEKDGNPLGQGPDDWNAKITSMSLADLFGAQKDLSPVWTSTRRHKEPAKYAALAQLNKLIMDDIDRRLHDPDNKEDTNFPGYVKISVPKVPSQPFAFPAEVFKLKPRTS